MNEKKDMSFVAFEATQARTERTQKRLIIAIAISIGCMFLSNAVWLWVFLQRM